MEFSKRIHTFVSSLKNTRENTPPNTKTIRQWFESCENPTLRGQLLANLLPEFADNTTDSLSREIVTLNQAINAGFYWHSASEGFDFWNATTNYEFAPKN